MAALSNTSSILPPQSFYFSSSTPAKHGSLLPHTPISTSTALHFNPYTKFRNLRVTDHGCKYAIPSIFKRSFSSHQANQHSHTNSIEGSEPDEFIVTESTEDKKLPLSLRSLMQAYRKAILDGDGKVICEVEDMIFMIGKKKKELAQEVSALSSEISSGKEKYVRLQADFDNYRKRSEKERLTIRSDAQGEVIESLLPMVDSFERAKQQIKLETDKEKNIDASYQGIYKQFVEIMRSLRVAVVPTVGKPFDPSVHEAIAREESYQFKEGIVTQEFRRGFFLRDRLLRPATVKVSSGPGKKKPPTELEQPSSKQPASVAGVED